MNCHFGYNFVSEEYRIDTLEFTSKWLKRNYEAIDLNNEHELKNAFNKILNSAFIELLKCLTPSFVCYQDKIQDNVEDDYPETLLLIRNRIDLLREQVFKASLMSSIFVVTFAAIGEPLQSIKEFRTELKQQLSSIISPTVDVPLQLMKVDDLKSLLTSVALQVIKSIQSGLEKYVLPQEGSSVAGSSSSIKSPLDDKKIDSLTIAIQELASPSNRIRFVMERRILEFIEKVIASNVPVPSVQVPSGLSSFGEELTQVSAEFARLVAHNRAVYSPYYTKLVADIWTASNRSVQNGELVEIEKSLCG